MRAMGRAFLVWRLAAADVRRHPVEAGLLVLAITAATATLTVGLALYGVTSSPYQRTRAATAGPDVVASLLNLAQPPTGRGRGVGRQQGETIFGNLGPSNKRMADLRALVRAPGVTGHSGPFPVAWATLRVHGLIAGVAAEGRDRTAANVDQPLVTGEAGFEMAERWSSRGTPMRSAFMSGIGSRSTAGRSVLRDSRLPRPFLITQTPSSPSVVIRSPILV